MSSKSGVSDPIAEPNYGYSRTPQEMPPGMNPASNAGRPPTTGPQDYLDIKAVDATNEPQVISAAVNKALLQTRLELVPWNWFITCQGAYQDTKVYGVCISHQYWRYEQVKEVVPAFDDVGKPIMAQASDGQMYPMGEEHI